MAKVQLPAHRTLKDMGREPKDPPAGVWELRAIKLSRRDRTVKEEETVEYTLTAEPIKPGSNVDPNALAEIDPITGKPAYEGKRLFLRYTELFTSEIRALLNALAAMGFSENEDFDAIIEKNLVRNRHAKGELWYREFKKDDGTQGTEPKVKNWAPVGTSAAMAL